MKLEVAFTLDSGPNADAELEFMVASEKEFEEIMAMSEGIYGGMDYLPSRYHSWIKEPDRTVVLVKKDGEVIGLQSVCIVDGGETALMEGLRVAPWERGKGVARVLQQFCAELVRQRHPGVKVARLTRDDKLGPKDFLKYRVITKQAILLMKFNARDFSLRLRDIVAALRGSNRLPPALLLEKSEVPAVVLDPVFIRKVLPGQTIIQDWQPFQPLASNLALLLKKELRWMVDSRADPLVATVCSPPFPIPKGQDWVYLNVDVFGQDFSRIQSQLLAHLQNRIQTLEGNVMCELFLVPELWEAMAQFCTCVLKVELAKDYTEQYLLEYDI
ncbi:LOW QUALITY PROTEIN: putative N-acetyltransferase 16 [Microcaecilia unicolor]|uniref:LOW QUALITY PROTEIN: probable N-acetyltransferase 16 n=1 Tax=Microcaecilia unicolor TaxID=1415580 RepID=A0A6P7WKE5_9AMPH|nr:LOW QUALITY PROTEIN: probable N-acetyltransferase 16 [Microcaecilia unicolor]